MQRLTRALIAACLAGGLTVALAPQPASAATKAPSAPDVQAHQKRQLAKVRAATARFRLPQAAIDNGYVASPTCTALPGVGAMGYHYTSSANINDHVLNIRRPETLVYVPTRHGLRLGAVEYFQPDADQNVATTTDRPSLFGRPFDGPMLGHAPGMPIHYDLHVWLYKKNPAGLFANWNPAVTCPAAIQH